MGVLNNGQHELFVQKWHETGNKTEAFKYAFPDQSSRWKEETINKRASELSLKREVTGRYNELKQETADNHGITIAGLIEELEQARKMAMSPENAQSSGAVSATMSKAKLVGLDVIKIEVTEKESLTPWDGITFGPTVEDNE